MAKQQYIYGKGNSSKIIIEIINNYFEKKLSKINEIDKLNHNNILLKYDNLVNIYNNSINNNSLFDSYDLVIILTIWKRNNLENQLIQVKRQSILKGKKTKYNCISKFKSYKY